MGTVSHSVAADLQAAHQRTALSRPESAALAAVEALGWVAGWEEPDLGGYMGMKAAAGQRAVYWCPGGRPKEKQGERDAYLSVCPQEERSVRGSHPWKMQPSSTQTRQRSHGCPWDWVQSLKTAHRNESK